VCPPGWRSLDHMPFICEMEKINKNRKRGGAHPVNKYISIDYLFIKNTNPNNRNTVSQTDFTQITVSSL
jgi:hypothetical protein